MCQSAGWIARSISQCRMHWRIWWLWLLQSLLPVRVITLAHSHKPCPIGAGTLDPPLAVTNKRSSIAPSDAQHVAARFHPPENICSEARPAQHIRTSDLPQSLTAFPSPPLREQSRTARPYQHSQEAAHRTLSASKPNLVPLVLYVQ